MRFSWAAHGEDKSVYEFGTKFMAEHNIKAKENRTEANKIKKFIADQIIKGR